MGVRLVLFCHSNLEVDSGNVCCRITDPENSWITCENYVLKEEVNTSLIFLVLLLSNKIKKIYICI